MSTPKGGLVPRLLERGLTALATASARRPVLTLAILAALAVAAFLGARTLKLDANMAALLPEDVDSVLGLEAMERRFGGVGYIVVVARGADPETLRRFADEVAPKLEALPTIHWADYKRPTDFFEDHALYYADLQDLNTVNARLKARVAWEKRTKNPLYIDLEDSTPPPVDFPELRDKYHARAHQDGASLTGGGDEPYYLDKDGRLLAILLKPGGLATDFGNAGQAVDDVRRFLETLDTQSYGPDLRLALTGRYVKQIDQKNQIQRDLGACSLLALLLMALYVVVHFRRLGAVPLLLLPLGIGVLWSLGLAAALFSELNILTGFAGAVIAGMGIDHGIHLLGRYDALRAGGASADEARTRTFGETGRANLAAALTTAAAFLALTPSGFRAFAELGVVAGSGILLIVVAFATGLPALLAIAERIGYRPRPALQTRPSTYARHLVGAAPALLWISAIIIWAISGAGLSRLGFDYDARSLEATELPSFKLDIEVNSLLGYSQTPIIMLTPDLESERATVAALRARKAALGDQSTIDFVASVADLVPEQVEAKAGVLRQLQETLKDVKPSMVAKDFRDDLDRLTSLAAAEPFGRDQLPIQIQRQFRGDAGRADEGFVLVFPAISLSDGLRVIDLAAEVRDLPVQTNGRIWAAGEAMIMADVVTLLQGELPRLLLTTTLALALILFLVLGDLRQAVLALVPAVLTALIFGAVLGLAEVHFNYLNVVFVSVLLGVAVDGGIHMIVRRADGESPAQLLDGTGRAIVGSIVTSALGFGALLWADHQGLRSIGMVMLLGLATNLLVTLVIFPSVLALPDSWRALRDRHPNPFWSHFWVTVGFAGASRWAPGTVGALSALPLAWLLSDLSWPLRIALVLGLTLLSIWLVNRHLKPDQRDPQYIVIDELVGCAWTLIAVPATAGWYLAGFLAFRLLDIFKPGPIRMAERRLAGGLGVVGDDVVAGLIGGAALFSLHWFSVL